MADMINRPTLLILQTPNVNRRKAFGVIDMESLGCVEGMGQQDSGRELPEICNSGLLSWLIRWKAESVSIKRRTVRF
jgi:hypothetical protein